MLTLVSARSHASSGDMDALCFVDLLVDVVAFIVQDVAVRRCSVVGVAVCRIGQIISEHDLARLSIPPYAVADCRLVSGRPVEREIATDGHFVTAK